MEKREAAKFLFTIANEIKRSFETPVIFLTGKDYADDIYKLLVDMRRAIVDGACRERLADIVVSFHRDWLQAVRELRKFQRQIENISREYIISSVEYTIKCIKQRSAYFQQYILTIQKNLSNNQRSRIQTDIEIIDDMQDSISDVLKTKIKYFSAQTDKTEFEIKVKQEIEELLNWLDRLNDNLAIQFCGAIGLVPVLLAALLNTSKLFINETQEAENSATANVSLHDLEILKLVEKIAVLTKRIQRLQDGSSAAVMALQNKKLYLVERLKTLELWITKQKYTNQDSEIRAVSLDKMRENIENVHMFDHRLAGAERFRLVEGLVNLWKVAINRSGKIQSTISILSCVNPIKEVYSDNLGKFTLDVHGRKIYKMLDDDRWFQADESGVLVPIDDDDNVYFYDDCGRYYLGGDGLRRIYKAPDKTSEYVIETTGEMFKYKDIKNGVEYYYNNIGRYYINEKGERIYRNIGSKTEYTSDGFGNLVRIRSEDFVPYDCTLQPLANNASNYLKQTIGTALKKCLADVVLHQPVDPILYLADALETYGRNKESEQRHQDDKREMMDLRKKIKEDEDRNAATITDVSSQSEANTHDSNFMHYETIYDELQKV